MSKIWYLFTHTMPLALSHFHRCRWSGPTDMTQLELQSMWKELIARQHSMKAQLPRKWWSSPSLFFSISTPLVSPTSSVAYHLPYPPSCLPLSLVGLAAFLTTSSLCLSHQIWGHSQESHQSQRPANQVDSLHSSSSVPSRILHSQLCSRPTVLFPLPLCPHSQRTT